MTDQATFEIKCFSHIKSKTHCTKEVELCGIMWRLLMFPNGNNIDSLSIYVECLDVNYLEPQEEIFFTIEVVNQVNSKESYKRGASHMFTSEFPDWGFANFMKLSAIRARRSEFLKDDKLIVNLDMEFAKDSRKQTGHVGLQNHMKETKKSCVNSLLQILYHIPAFRRAVYQIRTDDEAELETSSVGLAVQNIFCRLQLGRTSASTTELLKCPEWKSLRQCEELEKQLLLCLQNQLAGAGEIIERFFQGKVVTTVKCAEFGFESKSEEVFSPLSPLTLDVKGCGDVVQSLEKFVKETNNRFIIEDHGFQNVVIERSFETLPPILHLHLKYPKFSFPETLDLSKFMTHEVDKSSPIIYHLYAVLSYCYIGVERYWVSIRPFPTSSWFKFSDDKVSATTIEKVRQDNQQDGTYACKLVYLAEAKQSLLRFSGTDSYIPSHVKQRFEKEESARIEIIKRKSREKVEEKMYITLQVAVEKDFRKPRKVEYDLVDFDSVGKFKIPKSSTINEFKKQAAELYNIPPERQRYWYWVSSHNSIRPLTVVTPQQEAKPVVEIFAAELPRLFLEASDVPESYPPFSRHSDNIVVFIKHYDPISDQLRYVGHVNVRSTKSKPTDLVPLMNNFVGQSPTTPLLIFAELATHAIVPLSPSRSLRDLDIASGDILVFQRVLTIQESKLAKHTSVPEYYSYLQNRTVVKLRNRDDPKKNLFTLELTKFMLFDEVLVRIASILGTDPFNIRLTGHDPVKDIPNPIPISYGQHIKLIDMLVNYRSPMTDVLFYETLT